MNSKLFYSNSFKIFLNTLPYYFYFSVDHSSTHYILAQGRGGGGGDLDEVGLRLKKLPRIWIISLDYRETTAMSGNLRKSVVMPIQ